MVNTRDGCVTSVCAVDSEQTQHGLDVGGRPRGSGVLCVNGVIPPGGNVAGDSLFDGDRPWLRAEGGPCSRALDCQGHSAVPRCRSTAWPSCSGRPSIPRSFPPSDSDRFATPKFVEEAAQLLPGGAEFRDQDQAGDLLGILSGVRPHVQARQRNVRPARTAPERVLDPAACEDRSRSEHHRGTCPGITPTPPCHTRLLCCRGPSTMRASRPRGPYPATALSLSSRRCGPGLGSASVRCAVLYRAESAEEAIAILNDSPFRLGAAVFGRELGPSVSTSSPTTGSSCGYWTADARPRPRDQ